MYYTQTDKGPKFLPAGSGNSRVCWGKRPWESYPNTLFVSINECILAKAVGFDCKAGEQLKAGGAGSHTSVIFSPCCCSVFSGYRCQALMGTVCERNAQSMKGTTQQPRSALLPCSSSIPASRRSQGLWPLQGGIG